MGTISTVNDKNLILIYELATHVEEYLCDQKILIAITLLF